MTPSVEELIARLEREYTRTGAYAPEATCRHGEHPYDCRQGCAPPTFEAAEALARQQAELGRLKLIETRLDMAICTFLNIDADGPGDCTDRLVNGVHQAARRIDRLTAQLASHRAAVAGMIEAVRDIEINQHDWDECVAARLQMAYDVLGEADPRKVAAIARAAIAEDPTP